MSPDAVLSPAALADIAARQSPQRRSVNQQRSNVVERLERITAALARMEKALDCVFDDPSPVKAVSAEQARATEETRPPEEEEA